MSSSSLSLTVDSLAGPGLYVLKTTVSYHRLNRLHKGLIRLGAGYPF